MSYLSNTDNSSTSPSGTTNPIENAAAQNLNRFICCVTQTKSAQRIKNSLSGFNIDFTVLENDNLHGIQEADIVILACKPHLAEAILQEEGIREALQGKLLISILAGVPASRIEEILYSAPDDQDLEAEGRCRIVRAMPNTAALHRQSMTVIATPTPPLPLNLDSLVTWIFTRIGRVVRLPPAAMDVSTALAGSGPAFFAMMLEAMADGAVAMGLPRTEAQVMAAQTMLGTAELVLKGEHPALVREKVSTPGGCTIGGLLVLEEGSFRGTVARGLREATVVASQLGMGIKGVNGPRR